jgi:hypothetical protein
MSVPADAPRMDEAIQTLDIEALLREIRLYLDAVDAFRDADCEPRWATVRGPVGEPRLPHAATRV